MSIADQLTEDMKASMKAGTTERTGTLRLLRGALKNEEIKIGQPLDEAGALKVLQHEAKQRRDSIEAYEKARRDDLLAHEQTELEVIQAYLPAVMSEDEVVAVVERVVAQTGATSAAQMGQVMGAVMKEVGARADGATVSRLVREKLA